MSSLRRRPNSTGCRCCDRQRNRHRDAKTRSPPWEMHSLCIVSLCHCDEFSAGGCSCRGPCRLAQSVHGPDAGAAGARKDRCSVVARTRSCAIFRRAAGRAPADRPRLGRGGAASAPGPRARCTVRCADHARAAARRTHPAVANSLAAGLRRHQTDDTPDRGRAWSGAARRNGDRRHGCRVGDATTSGSCDARPGLGTARNSPRALAR